MHKTEIVRLIDYISQILPTLADYADAPPPDQFAEDRDLPPLLKRLIRVERRDVGQSEALDGAEWRCKVLTEDVRAFLAESAAMLAQAGAPPEAATVLANLVKKHHLDTLMDAPKSGLVEKYGPRLAEVLRELPPDVLAKVNALLASVHLGLVRTVVTPPPASALNDAPAPAAPPPAAN